MPRIFDNIEQSLLPALRETLQVADHADFCVGYFNLRGWKQLDSYIEKWVGGEGHCCRLLVGMQRLPQEDLRKALSLITQGTGIDKERKVSELSCENLADKQKKAVEAFKNALKRRQAGKSDDNWRDDEEYM
ncbi:MAG: hypothetical protein WD425_16040 [Nitrospirales bacterium]